MRITATILALVVLAASALGMLWYAERAAHRRTDAQRLSLEARAALAEWQRIDRDAARWRVFAASELGDDETLASALAGRAGLGDAAPDTDAARAAFEAGVAATEELLGAPLAFACLLDPAGRVVASVERIEGLPDDLSNDGAASRALSYGTSSDGLERYGDDLVLTAAAPVVYDGRLVVGAVVTGVTVASALDPSAVQAASGLPATLSVARRDEVLWTALPADRAAALPWADLASELDAVRLLPASAGGGIAVGGLFRGAEGDDDAVLLVLTLPDGRLSMAAGSFAARAGDLDTGAWGQWLPPVTGLVLLLVALGVAGFERHKHWERAFKAGQEAEHRTMRVAYPTDELPAPTGEIEATREPTPRSAELPATPIARLTPTPSASAPRQPAASPPSPTAPAAPTAAGRPSGKVLRPAKASGASPRAQKSPAKRPREMVIERTSESSQDRVAVDDPRAITPPPLELDHGGASFEIERIGAGNEGRPASPSADFEIERTDGRVERISGSHAPPAAAAPAPAPSPSPPTAAAAPLRQREPSGIYIGTGEVDAGGGYAGEDLGEEERRALLQELFGETEHEDIRATDPHDARLDELLGGFAGASQAASTNRGATKDERAQPTRPILGEAPAPGTTDYYRLVFREFIEARRECNQPVDGLGFDAFLQRVKKKEDDFKARYACDAVELEVYIRDGKAGLKARRPRSFH